MFLRLLLLFTLVPITELALLIQIGKYIGVGATIAIVIGTGILGAYLARREGIKTWFAMSDSIHRGQSPAPHMIEGLLILIAGAMLLTPGLITDTLGFALLIPPLRRAVRRRISARIESRIRIITPDGTMRTPDYEVIEPEELP